MSSQKGEVKNNQVLTLSILLLDIKSYMVIAVVIMSRKVITISCLSEPF